MVLLIKQFKIFLNLKIKQMKIFYNQGKNLRKTNKKSDIILFYLI